MDKILPQAEMLRRWPKPKITIGSDRKKSYVTVADKVGEYETHLKKGTLTLVNQKSILKDISEKCSTFLTEDKGQHMQQGQYLRQLKKMADKILEQDETFCTKSHKWRVQKWAWDKAVAIAKSRFCHEPFEFYEAVQKWITVMHCSRNGAWYILTNHLKTSKQVDVGLAEGGMDPKVILGVPSASINIPHRTYLKMADMIRRAHQTMFDEAIGYIERTTQWQYVQPLAYFQAVSRQLKADVHGPLGN